MSVARMPLVAVVLPFWFINPTSPDEQASLATDEALLKGAGLKTDGPALLEFFRKNTLHARERERLQQLVHQLGDPSFRVREQAAAELMKLGRIALPSLRRAAADPDAERARRAERCLRGLESAWATDVPVSAARVLAHRAPAGALGVLLDYLPTADEGLGEDGFLAAVARLGLRDGQADPLLLKALADRHPAVRQAAGWVVGRSRSVQQRALARPLLADADPAVRLRTAQGLLAARDRDAVPALIALLPKAPLG